MQVPRWAWPALVAALALVLLLWPGEDGAEVAPPGAGAPTHPVTEAEALYEEAIGDIESAIRAGEAPTGFDEVQEAMEPEIEALDAAIAESRRLAAEAPDDEEAQETLLQTLRRKLDLFHNTLMLMQDLERGDGATAQERIEALSGREPPETG